MKNLLYDQRGSLLPIMAAAIIVVLALAAVAVDYARYSAASDKLQTATEAAALAGAASADRYVKLEVNSQHWSCCGNPCTPCCVPCEPKIITGKEKDLIDNNGWKQYCCDCECSMKILDRWVEYRNDVNSAVQMFFNANIPKEMSSAHGGNAGITSVTVHGNRNDPSYPTVAVKAQGKVKTLFMNFLNKIAPGVDFSFLGATKCSQSETRYYELNGKFVKTAVNDDCE